MNRNSRISHPFPGDGLALVLGSTGGMGSAMTECLVESGQFAAVKGLARRTEPPLDVTDEASIAEAASAIGQLGMPLRLVFDATGFLHDDDFMPEKSFRPLDPRHLARAFEINATGPGLLMKHFLPLMARDGKAVFATLSARVGSIGDNRFGGWYAYRASKAALNQLVRTAAIELGRSARKAICVALHPGTVDTALSAPFAKSGLDVRPPEQAAGEIWQVIQRLSANDSGGFFDHRGESIDW